MREHHRRLMDELRSSGHKPRLIRTGGGHARIEWDDNGETCWILTGWTPSDRRSTANALSWLRRQLRKGPGDS